MTSSTRGDPHPWRGPLLILAASLLWSFGGVGIKSLAGSHSAIAITGWRSLFSLALLLPAARLSRERLALFFRPLMLGTAAVYTATVILFVAATTLTTAANAILLQYTAPFWVILFCLFGDEKPRLREILLAGACFAGLAFFFLDRVSPDGLRGILLALLSGCALAVMTLGLRSLAREGDGRGAVDAVIGGNLLCSLLCAPWMVTSIAGLTAPQWGILAALGLGQIALPYLLFSAGVREVSALRATLLSMLEPLLNPVWVALATGEIPGNGTLLGGGLIIVCLVLDAALPRRPEEAIVMRVD